MRRVWRKESGEGGDENDGFARWNGYERVASQGRFHLLMMVLAVLVWWSGVLGKNRIGNSG